MNCASYFQTYCKKDGHFFLCEKCGYHYCTYHLPINNSIKAGGHVCVK